MPVKNPKNHSANSSPTQLSAWIPAIIPTLKARWPSFISTLPDPQAGPSLSDWLALLHIADTMPWKIYERLARLLHYPKSGLEFQNSWIKLTHLFTLTFEAAQAEADKLEPEAWQNLIDIQNRILKHAAQSSLIRENRPDTNILTRRALYLQAVTELSKKIVDIHDPDELLDEVVYLIQKNFGYEYVNLFHLHRAEQTLTLRNAIWKHQQSIPTEEITLKVGIQGIVGRVAATGRMMMVNDVSKDPNYLAHPALSKIKSQLAVPLIVGNNLVGVLDIESDQRNAFGPDDYRIVQALANHVAVAIENARLQTSLQRHLREKNLIYESNVTLGTSLDVDTVLKLMTRKIAEALDAGACTICRINHKAQTITSMAEYIFRYPGNPHSIWRKPDVPIHLSKDPVGQQALKTARPVISRAREKATGHNTLWPLDNAKSPDEKNKSTWGVVLALPLTADDQNIGLIEIYDKNPQRDFSTDDIQLCQILATQTTVALERARLFDETRQRLGEVATLYTLAKEISGTLDLQVVLDRIVVALRQVVGCRGCCIFLIDQSSNYLEIKAAAGLKPHWRKMAKLNLGEGAAGQAAAENRTIYLSDTHQEPSFIFFDEEVRSLMVTPLMAHGEVIGTINVDDSQPHAFGRTQERLLTIAAAQAGIVIENARLFARVSAEQQQNQAIIQHVADGLLMIDSRGVIITCNHALATMLGMHPGQITGQKVHSPHLDPNLASITANTTYQARTGVLAKEVTIKTPRLKTLQIFSTPVLDDEKNKVGEVRVVHDITKERELDHLKDDFVSTISHELRTPLFSIHGFAQVLLDEEKLDEETRVEFLATIKRQAAQLSDMVNNLLDLSKFDAGLLRFEKKPVMIIDLIHQTVLKLQGFAHERNVQLKTKLPDLLPEINGDRQRLEQVLTNLIGNAIKFTEAGGQVLISATKTGQEIVVAVQDTGIGIPEEELDQIFSRYHQVEHQSERTAMGSGLGLHIAKKIVQGHGGRIWAESTAGQGSTFRFTLPIPPSDDEDST